MASNNNGGFPEISDNAFRKFQQFMYKNVGVKLHPEKKALIVGRVGKRLRHYGLNSFDQYISKLIESDDVDEKSVLIDLLTTHETYFFREPTHFQLMADIAKKQRVATHPFRVWSAACSTGEEPYTIAMVLLNELKDRRWQVVASDVSAAAIETARRALYPEGRINKVPKAYLHYLLRGVRAQEGNYLVDQTLRSCVEFSLINLNATLPDMGHFDIIFLRNILIYFDADNKKRIIKRLIEKLQPGGHLFIGHSETLSGVTSDLKFIQASVYEKVK